MATFFGRMGSSGEITVPSGEKIGVWSNAPVKVYRLVGTPNHPAEWLLHTTTIAGTEYTSAAMTAATIFRLEASYDDGWYETGAAPAISEPLANQTMSNAVALVTGLGAAAGGTLHAVGGTSSGAGNAGGAAGVRGGQPGAGGAGGVAEVAGGAGNGVGNGGIARVVAGASGAGATGNGGDAQVTGGAAASTDGNGGNVTLAPGALAGTGKAGMVRARGVLTQPQGAPAAEIGVATLSAADLLGGIITLTHATGATVALTLETGANIDLAVQMAAGDSFDWYLINLSAAAADTGTVTASAGHTIVGNPIVQSAHATTGGITGNAGHFRTRKTGADTFVTYRIG